jgi:asparagine N-glycosylation enzyme membrane subunit Stt3
MKFSPPPDFRSNRRLLLAALAVTLIASAGVFLQYSHLAKTLGDPDDAMRLVLVRELMAGRGWYDQLVTRLQPPLGTMMHWSRLVDAGLAAMIWAFRLVLPAPAAEMAVRLLWPLLLIFPAVACALAMARRLGGSLAVFVCAVLLAVNQLAFAQFVPGRVDHHNIQITLVMIAMTCAMSGERRSHWALLAGASTGLALAVGIEGLPFHVVVGASYGLLAALGRDDARTTRNYAAALLAATLGFYLLQTPLWRWHMAFCDAIGANFVSAIAAAACGLLVMTAGPVRTSPRSRITVMVLTAIAASAAYLAFDPRCIRGVFAAVDPRIVPFWFKNVSELQPLPVMMLHDWNFGIALILMSAMMLAAAIFLLLREWPRPSSAMVIASTALLVAIATGYFAFRMESYVQWLGFPILASAFSVFAARFWGGLMAPTAAFATLLSPVGAVAVAMLGFNAVSATPDSRSSAKAVELCHDTAAYRPLATLPPGLVLADIYMGPFILAHTPHSALTAPYHRMTWGILAAHDAVTATSAQAQAKMRALKIDYLVECPTNTVPPAPKSIEEDLARGQVPDWLEKLSAKGDALQIYRVQRAP